MLVLATAIYNNNFTKGVIKMNMKKLLIVTLIITAVLFALSLTGCEDDNDDPAPAECNCLETYGTTAHLGISETCTCGGTGCNCTEQTATVGGITVRKQAGVTVQQMNTAVANINTVYGILDDIQIPIFTNKVSVIHIVTGNTVTLEGTTLKVGLGADDETIAEYVLFTLVAE
jgi:hypothetical protein